MNKAPLVKIVSLYTFDNRDTPIRDDASLNIAYGVDENYLFGSGVSISSILQNNTIPLIFHVIADEFSHDYIEKIEKLSVTHKTKISLYKINAENLKSLPSTKVWSHAMYFRLFAFEYFSASLDKLLYLDADIICKGSIEKLSHIDLSGYIAGVVRDVESMQRPSAERLGIDKLSGSYFNSGVVLINLNDWHKSELTKKAFLLLNDGVDGIQLKYPDQDVLNILLHDKVIILGSEFNTIYTIKSELFDNSHNEFNKLITENTKLIHYTGVTKPWHEWANYPSVKYFTSSYVNSPWKNCPLKKAISFIELKKRYKHQLAQGKLISGFISGAIYGYNKYFLKYINKKR